MGVAMRVWFVLEIETKSDAGGFAAAVGKGTLVSVGLCGAAWASPTVLGGAPRVPSSF